MLERHDFGDGRARYEAAPEAHHDHLIHVETGNVIEFVGPELEQHQRQIAEKLGFRLVDHRMEIYGVALSRRCRGCVRSRHNVALNPLQPHDWLAYAPGSSEAPPNEHK